MKALLVLALAQAAQAKPAVLALSGADVAALSQRSGLSATDLLERARVLGVSSVLLRDETVQDAIDRGEILQFSRAEVEKWRALGLIAAGAPVRPGSLWTKDKDVMARLSSSASRSGVLVSTSAAAGYQVADFPKGSDTMRLSLGLEPESLKDAEKASLSPALAAASFREVRAEEGCGEALRAAFEAPAPALLWRLSPELDVEGNFDVLRACAGRLKAAGIVFGPPGSSVPGKSYPALCWLLAVLGPLLSARAGLRALRRARTFARLEVPGASPVLELSAAVLAVGAAASAAGLAAAAAGGSARVLLAPLLLGLCALYVEDFPAWRARARQPVTPADLFRAAAAAAAVFLIGSHHALTPWMRRVTSLFESSWWWPWRWREMLVGFPALVLGFDALDRQWSCPECGDEPKLERPKRDQSAEDPRLLLLLGIVAPAGMMAAVASPGMTWQAGLAQAWMSLAIGGALSAALVGARRALGAEK